ncbi:hypothetical protein G5714_024721 [Onychostoma macrolepis]|uniref:HAT C-terminal dimerisation domain-containing protein n=1 Tax=Onychostoma macrolepis TaxID=369639 RepID=A0A7J6BHQ2_9TELE|nr:hypothetical protein G5714_024721 [Onychostoma macrolepis]
MAVIRSTKEHLFTIRSDTEWEAVLEKAKSFAVTLGISPEYAATVSKSRPARLQKVSSLLSGYLTASTTGSRETMGADNAKRVYFSVIDCFVAEFCRRFSDNDALLQSLEAFDKNSPLFMDSAKIVVFADYYSAHVDEVILESQSLPVAFSELMKLFQIVLTLPITTASNERFFSVLKQVKTYLRTTMGDERLSHLMLMSVEKALVKCFDLDELVTDFALLRPRRYPLMQ